MSTSRAGNAAAAERLRLLRAVLAERGLTGSAAGARTRLFRRDHPWLWSPIFNAAADVVRANPFSRRGCLQHAGRSPN